MVKPKIKSRRRLGARHYKNYTNEMVDLAVEYVRKLKMSSREAEKRFGVPRRTLMNKVKNLHCKKVGPPTRLTEEEEKNIVKVVVAAGDFGCPLTKLDVRVIVYDYLKKNGREAIFCGKLPGKQWLLSFMERNASELTVRSCQNIKKARAEKSVDEILDYFKNLEESVKGVPPSNILNFDETNLSDDPGTTKCIFRRGVKYPERILNSTKGAISLMFSTSADGMNLPPYVVYKSENLFSEWITGGPRGTRYNRTRSGWFDSCTFEDYFKTVVIKWAEGLPGRKVVICDNLSSHLNVDIIKLCKEHNISFVFIPASSTHLTQPLDVAFFAPLKKAWRKILLQYKMENPNQTSLNKNHFPKLLTSLIDEINLTDTKNIKSGFKATGIYPLNPREVLKRLPEYAEDIGNYTVDNALLDFLQKCRQPKPMTIKRNKKVSVEPGKSVSISDFDSLTCLNQEVTKTQKSKKNSGIGAKKSKTTKNITSITNQNEQKNNDAVTNLFSENEAIEEPIKDKNETTDVYDYILGDDILNDDDDILLNLVYNFDNNELDIISDRDETVTNCNLDEKTGLLDTNIFEENNKTNDELVNKKGTSCTWDKKSEIILAGNDSDDIFNNKADKLTVKLEDQENVSRYILNEKTGFLQHIIVTQVKQIINNKPVLRDKINLNLYKDVHYNEAKKLQNSKPNILTQSNTSTNETKICLKTDKNIGKENENFQNIYSKKEANRFADTKVITKPNSVNRKTNQSKKKIKTLKSTTKPKTKPARRTYKRPLSETSNSDINISTYSDSDICEIESDKSDNDFHNLDTKKPKPRTESNRGNKVEAQITEEPSTSYGNLSEACSNVTYAVGDTVMVRYFFKKKVDYFVGSIIEKVGNNKVNVSFFKKTGKNDNTKFIKTKTQEEEIIDCKNIVKTVNLFTINTNETEFILYDDDDYIYFD